MMTMTQPVRSTMLPLAGATIVRTTEKLIGPLRLDSATRQRLATDRIGLMISGVPSFESMVRRIAALENYDGGRWIAVPATKELANVAHQHLVDQGHRFKGNPLAGPVQLGALQIATIEQLRKIDPVGVEGLVLLDPSGMVHKSRNWRTPTGYTHDRPQRIVNFLATVEAENCCGATFAIMTTVPAKSLLTERIASTYCLEGWQCLDGVSTRFARTVEVADETPDDAGIVHARLPR